MINMLFIYPSCQIFQIFYSENTTYVRSPPNSRTLTAIFQSQNQKYRLNESLTFDYCLSILCFLYYFGQARVWHGYLCGVFCLGVFCRYWDCNHNKLRRSLSLILWITLVSFINAYCEYFCKITGCFGIKTLWHITRKCKLRFFIYTVYMHIIEQNTQYMYNMMSYECHLMEIIKG